MKQTKIIRPFLTAAVVCVGAVLAACGSDSNPQPAASGTGFGDSGACPSNIAGPADSLQGGLISLLVPAEQRLPQGSLPATDLTQAIAELLDVVDALQGAAQGNSAGVPTEIYDTLSCATNQIKQATAGLVAVGQSFTPSTLAAANDLLSTITALEQQLSAAATGGTPDPTAITSQLALVATDLGALLDQLTAGSSVSTGFVAAGAYLQTALTDVGADINAAATGDKVTLGKALQTTVNDLSGIASIKFLTALGIDNATIDGLASELGTAFNTTLTKLLSLLGL